MDRRRLLLANSHASGGGGGGLDFPIVLESDYCEEKYFEQHCYKALGDSGVQLRESFISFCVANGDDYGGYYYYVSDVPLIIYDGTEYYDIEYYENEIIILWALNNEQLIINVDGTLESVKSIF